MKMTGKSISIQEYAARFRDNCEMDGGEVDLKLAGSFVLPPRKVISHKYSYGRALMIGGSAGFSGAPSLAANACERSGAGLTHLMVPESVYTIAAAKCDGAVVTPLRCTEAGTIDRNALDAILPALKKASACAIGPGLGLNDDTGIIVESVINNADCPIVLDADALTICGRNMKLLEKCRVPLILTPHEGEFRRLGGDLTNGRLAGAVRFIREHRNAVLVLKGYGTLVAAESGITVNPTGGPALAKGGSGDVLCGIICALLAQGFDPVFSARCGVYIHGAAGDLAAAHYGDYSVAPSDLIRLLPEVFKDLIGDPEG